MHSPTAVGLSSWQIFFPQYFEKGSSHVSSIMRRTSHEMDLGVSPLKQSVYFHTSSLYRFGHLKKETCDFHSLLCI